MRFSRLFTWALLVVLVAVALVAGAWYFVAPSKLASPAKPGSISGTVNYPGEFVPAQQVCAQSVTDSGWTKCVTVPEQQPGTTPTFIIPVPAGTYWVSSSVLHPADLGLTQTPVAYWTTFVQCGMTASCTDHTKLKVVVDSGATLTAIDPQDWFTDY